MQQAVCELDFVVACVHCVWLGIIASGVCVCVCVCVHVRVCVLVCTCACARCIVHAWQRVWL